MKRISFSPLLPITLMFVISSCKLRDDNMISISLKNRYSNNPLSKSASAISFIDTIDSSFQGVEGDSILIARFDFFTKSDSIYDQATDYISKTNHEINILTGYKNDKRFYTIDLNRDNDFSNDEKIYFEKELNLETYPPERIEEIFDQTTLPINKIHNKTIFCDTIGFRVFPNRTYFTYSNKGKSVTKETLFKRRSLLAIISEEYWEGSFDIEGIAYNVSVEKHNLEKPMFIFRKREESYPLHSEPNRKLYEIGDWIELNNHIFYIDNIDVVNQSLHLKKIQKANSPFGFRTGDTIKDYEVLNLRGRQKKMSNLFGNKQYLLLDFWGTWCEPCKALTPELLKLYEAHKTQIVFASLAYQTDVQPVIDYIEKHDIPWWQGHLKGKPKTANPNQEIIKELRVKAFPTFIVIDKNLKIVFRGHGGHFASLKEFLTEVNGN